MATTATKKKASTTAKTATKTKTKTAAKTEALVAEPISEAAVGAVNFLHLTKATEENKELQATIGEFCKAAMPYLVSRFNELSLSKQFDFIRDILPYATPKMQSSEISGGFELEAINAQVRQLADRSSKK